MRLNEALSTAKNKPFTGTKDIGVGDPYQLLPVRGRLLYADYKITWQTIECLWKFFKIFEVTQVIWQRENIKSIDLVLASQYVSIICVKLVIIKLAWKEQAIMFSENNILLCLLKDKKKSVQDVNQVKSFH